ncbi:3-hydroxyacyl-CoA dehydrogenase NAD-binding [Beutenbergia cavernae DSM 12333]|uniref:L-gulonate 3-dehydrogenase n=1 Tax=Beutenbergia cavernae (strain ATCC BAA-8 / DSM 12333 / CCUG 43141 / JCM 11478 / NBRC 16432 / NCIMB 13614 / HKI 0122) TaxID=471853 RepID=C5C3A2_BEUC1|nr:3-hydroxyacyl-CoA dehydrogenase family protein [Beutenbergia cavernae]ACQ79801.1 3-hydroxyacyl-CoA dehydrogenase NAD-binding [Beutenbergia cavernae DSM 12333]
MKQQIERVAVVGSGYMGTGIAQVLAGAGLDVVLADADAERARAGHARVLAEATSAEEAGTAPGGTAERVAAHLTWAASAAEAADGADFVEEAVPEVLGLKRRVLAEVSAATATAIIGSNTSTIQVRALADAVADPSRFLVVHWSNPAQLVPGVELVSGEATDPAAADAVRAMIDGVGRVSAQLGDAPGFVLNRLQFALVKEALAIVEEGHASPADVDAVVRSTLGFRAGFFGPLEMLDMAGLDVYADCYASLERELGPRFAPPRILTDAVERGRHGMKNGAGLWRDYTDDDVAALTAWRTLAYSRMADLLRELPPAPVRAATAASSDDPDLERTPA